MGQANKKTTLGCLELTGSPRERGRTHGEVYADAIAENVETYLSVFDYYGADKDTVYEQAREFVPVIEEANEEYFEEMSGIAEGADLSVEDVTVLNARYEVMYSAYGDAAEKVNQTPETDGCTAFGAQPEVTNSGHTVIGQNWDWIPDVNIFIMDIRRNQAPDMVAMTEAGIVGGKIGVNEHGIGMLLNGLVAEGDGENPFRKPYHIRFREALDADRLDLAIAPFLETDRANSANVLLGHAEGEMINLELAPETAHYLYPEDGLLTHANHFEDRSDVKSEFERILPNTLCRAPRLRRLLSKSMDNLKIEDAQKALRDHFGKPASVCAHIDSEKPEPEQGQTNASFIIDLNERSVLAARGPPCRNDYTRFEVGG